MNMTTEKPKPEFANLIPHWFTTVLEKLSATKALTDPNSLVRLGLGFDGYHLPKDVVVGLFEKAKSLGVKVITSHYIRPKGEKSPRVPALLKEYGLLDRGIVLAHAGGATAEDAKLMKEAGAHVSSTPSTEASMALGPTAVFRDDLPGMDSVCSFGSDCQAIVSSSIVNNMRMGLQHARGLHSAASLSEGRIPREVYHNTHEAFNMATLGGARALCMEYDLGSLEVGKRADLVVFSATSPSMLGAAQQDPVMAVVLHSSPGDVEDVIVDGVVRKRDGKLLSVESIEWNEDAGDFAPAGKEVAWSEVASRVLDIQERFITKRSKHDLTHLEETVVEMFDLA